MKVDGKITLDTGRTVEYHGWRKYGICHIDVKDVEGKVSPCPCCESGSIKTYDKGSLTVFSLGVTLVSYFNRYYKFTYKEERQLRELAEKLREND